MPDTQTKPDPVTITPEIIKGIVAEAIKDAPLPVIEELKTQVNELNRKTVFPFLDGAWGTGEAESMQGGKGSVIDTSYFSKSYHRKMGVRQDGIALGQQLCRMGGPFKRLSPELETFAKFIKVSKGDVYKAMSAGIDVKKYNEIITEHLKQAGMSEGILADGGALVPIEFYTSIVEFAIAQSKILSQVWRLPMTSNILRIPRLQQAAGAYFGGITLYTPGEGEEKLSTKPALERLTFEAKKLIGLVYLTDELVADSFLNIINYLFGLFTRAFQYEMERRVIAGLGTAIGGPCLGIINDPAVNVVARATAGTITYRDVINLDSALDENFSNLTWLTRKATQNWLMSLVDNANRPIFLADYSVFAGQPIHPPALISYPVTRTRNVPVIGTKGDLILGDLSFYLLTIRQDLTIDQSNAPRFIYDEQTLRFVMRFDGAPVVSIAFALLGDVSS